MTAPVRIVLTGGGSGGHVYPALAIGEIAGKRFPEAEFLYIGTRRGAESKIVPSRGIEIAYISVESFRKSLLSLALFGGVLFRASMQAYRILRRFNPDIIIATGGYSSAPVLLAGAMRRQRGGKPKIFIHEQNVVAGLANRLGGKFADKIGTTFGDSNQYFPSGKVAHVGYPLRDQIASISRRDARRSLGIDEKGFMVFAFGGSAGSRTINRAVVDALEKLLTEGNVHVIHAIGRYRGSDYDPGTDTRRRLSRINLDPSMMKRYRQIVYTEEIGKYYSASDIVVSRCGSGTLFELKRAGKPSILLPKIGSAGQHQLSNALAMEKEGSCAVIEEKQDEAEEKGVMKVEGALLAEKILDLKNHPEKLREMAGRMQQSHSPDTSEKIGLILEEMLRA